MRSLPNTKNAPSQRELVARAAKLQVSRKRLLDLTLRNRLLNFRPGDPGYKDDTKTHKHMVFKADIESLWALLVEDEKEACITSLTPDRIQQLKQEWERLGTRSLPLPSVEDPAVSLSIPPAEWERIAPGIRSINDTLRRGDLISLLPEEAFRKRAARIRKEQNSLIDSTGDSALFLALGFLQWTEAQPHPKAGQPIFAPLILLHVELQELRLEEGGERSYVLRMDGDQPQYNPCLAEKLREFNIDLPPLEEGEDARSYLAKVRRAVKTKKDWAVSDGVALGFFNFARYRLWLDLNPDEWPEGKAPAGHPVVGAILDGCPLEQPGNIPSEEEVARIQSEDDIPTVLDADSTQYAALLAAKRGASLVVIGPPGSGKSQTITNLIAVALAEGKRVLFVAQKLAALQVVQRNLRKVGIAQFCLPLFSDQARVTEVHKHLAASGDARRNSFIPQRPNNGAAPIAQKLNAHADKLATIPPGYSCSISQLIRKATALHLQVRELWGNDWSEDLLSISTPDGEPSDAWLDHREQCLLEWLRLKQEVVGWSNWSPLELGPLDVGQVEVAAQHYLAAVEALAAHCRKWPEVTQWDFANLADVSTKIAAAKIRELQNPIPKLVAYLCEGTANHAKAARLEQDLEELDRQRQQAQRILRVTPDTAAAVILRVGPANSTLAGLFNARCTLDRARGVMASLVGVLQAAEDLLAQTANHPEGVACLIPGQTAGELRWSHLELLAHCSPTPLEQPPNLKLRLARHIQEDPSRLEKAKALSIEIDIDQQLRAEIKASVGRVDAWGSPEAIQNLRSLLQICAESTLGAVRLGDLQALVPLMQQLAERIDAQLPTIAGQAKLPATMGLYAELAKLNRLSEAQWRGPDAADWQLLGQVQPEHLKASHLREFAVALGSVQKQFLALQDSLTGLRLEAGSLNETATALTNAHTMLQELGLAGGTIGALAATAELVRKLEVRFVETLGLCAQMFDRWQLRAPSTLGELQAAVQLLRLLTSRPTPPSPETEKAITTKTSVSTLWSLLQEQQALAEFSRLYQARIAFRDLPSMESIVQLRRDLRSHGASVFRLVSPRYWQLRKTTQGFLNAPLPPDPDIITLLDRAEEYSQRTARIQNHPSYPHFGGDEKRLEDYLHWLVDVVNLADMDDVSRILADCQDTAALKALLLKLESLLSHIEQCRSNAPDYAGLHGYSSAAWNTVEGLRKLTEANAALGTTLLRCSLVLPGRRQHAVPQLLVWAKELSACAEQAAGLQTYHDLIAQRPVGELNGIAINTAAVWLADLEVSQVPHEVTVAVARRAVGATQIVSVTASAARFAETLQALKQLTGCTQRWAADSTPLEGLGDRLTGLRAALTSLQTATDSFELKSHLTLERCDELAGYTLTLNQIRASFVEWEIILGERPAEIAPADITDTLAWLANLQAAGARGIFLNWLLAEETKGRIAWWTSTVARSWALLGRIKGIQDELLTPLHEPEESVEAWLARCSEQLSRISAALETGVSLCHHADTELQDFGAAVSSLARSLEIVERLKPWVELLGLQAEISSGTVTEHRCWVAGTRAIPALFGTWLQAEDFGERTRIVNRLVDYLGEAEKAHIQFKRCLSDHGPVAGLGPFATLDRNTSVVELAVRLRGFIEGAPLLPSYAAMLREDAKARTLGLTRLVELAEPIKPAATTLLATFRAAVGWQQAKSIWQADDALRLFSSSHHELLRQKFQKADEQLMQSNQKHIAARLSALTVTHGAAGRSPKDLSELQLLNHEMGKKRKHIPIRKLVQRAGRAMQDLSPCWMMTPLAVAQFLPAGEIDFDLVIMDEASQLNPEDAWGAIARGKQLVVVGDPKQMPPSDFFASTFEDDESEDEDDNISGGKAESILEAATISVPLAWLEWHYRSRHESLIAPANQFSYANKLILYPNPHREHAELGIRYTFAEGAAVTTGRVTNPIEAELVVHRLRELVLAENRKAVGQRKSIGVVAMNMHQAECIQDLVDNLRRADPKFDKACAILEDDAAEPLFIKNLENIQGDERDVMLISCTYGPQTPNGTPAQRFGPLNREGGERRFNVLITRAKWRMEIFASLKSHQVLIEGKKQGVADFHYFLKYAETGQLVEEGRSTRKSHDSPFEAQVDAVLQKAGYKVEPQIGVAGYYIDLAVRHPGDAGRFAIGIECDGETYHSSKAARDRDRLRERVLMDRGWHLHRIWSTDWFTNQRQARERLLRAVADACRL